jgi:hypothetical protein
MSELSTGKDATHEVLRLCKNSNFYSYKNVITASQMRPDKSKVQANDVCSSIVGYAYSTGLIRVNLGASSCIVPSVSFAPEFGINVFIAQCQNARLRCWLCLRLR